MIKRIEQRRKRWGSREGSGTCYPYFFQYLATRQSFVNFDSIPEILLELEAASAATDHQLFPIAAATDVTCMPFQWK